MCFTHWPEAASWRRPHARRRWPLAAFEISTHDIAITGIELEMLRAQHPATGSVTYRLVRTDGPCGMTDLVGESVFVLRLLRRNLQALRDRTGTLNGEHNPLSPAIKSFRPSCTRHKHLLVGKIRTRADRHYSQRAPRRKEQRPPYGGFSLFGCCWFHWLIWSSSRDRSVPVRQANRSISGGVPGKPGEPGHKPRKLHALMKPAICITCF